MKARIRRYIPRTRRAMQSLVQLHDAPWRWKVGLEAGLAVGLPVGLFTLAGYPSLGLQAALGSFTALYGSGLSRPDRARLLPLVAVGLVLAAALGVACAGSEWLTSACLVLVSGLACMLALGVRLGPPGPLMFVLVAAVSGHITAPAELGGAGQPGLRLLALLACGAGLAYLVIVAPLAMPGKHRRPALGLRRLFPHFGLDKEMTAIVLRVVAAVLVASLVSRPLGAHRAYWVIIAAMAVLQSGYSRRLTSIRAVHRVVGTLLGIALFELLFLTHPSGIWLVVLLMLLQGITEVVVARSYALALLFITPMALMNSTASHTTEALVTVTVQGRILDSLLGACIAMAVFWIGEGLLYIWGSTTRKQE